MKDLVNALFDKMLSTNLESEDWKELEALFNKRKKELEKNKLHKISLDNESYRMVNFVKGEVGCKNVSGAIKNMYSYYMEHRAVRKITKLQEGRRILFWVHLSGHRYLLSGVVESILFSDIKIKLKNQYKLVEDSFVIVNYFHDKISSFSVEEVERNLEYTLEV